MTHLEARQRERIVLERFGPCWEAGKKERALSTEVWGTPCSVLWIHIWPQSPGPHPSPRALGREDGKPKKRAQALDSCSRCAGENASLFKVQQLRSPCSLLAFQCISTLWQKRIPDPNGAGERGEGKPMLYFSVWQNSFPGGLDVQWLQSGLP